MKSNAERYTSKTKWRTLRKNIFLISTLIGVIVGGAIGYVLRPSKLSPDTVQLISYPGELYMRALKLMILPFVSVCLVTGTATINIRKNGMIAVRAAIYFLSTNVFSTAVGLCLAVWIHPGSHHVKFTRVLSDPKPKASTLDNFLDIGRNIFPENLFSSAFESTVTRFVSDSNGTFKKTVSSRPGTNMIGIVVFFLLFGSVLGGLGKKKKIVIDFFTVVYETLLKILLGIVRLTPVAVGSIICAKMYQVPDLGETLSQLVWFIFTVLTGLIIHQMVFVQVLYFTVIGSNPFAYYRKLFSIILTTFATASKSASMPVAINVLENKLRMNKRIVRFILPLGGLNLNGAAIFMATSLVFIAQINNISLELPDLASLLMSVTFMSMSLATIPSSSLVAIMILCGQINAPAEDVSLLFAIDWLIDRCRTTNNMVGDCYAIAILQKLSEDELQQNEEEDKMDLSIIVHSADNDKDYIMEKNYTEHDKELSQRSS